MAATKRNYRFKGHESFVLREGWLNKGLAALGQDERLFFQNSGADELGVGVNMAKAIRYWLNCAKLTEENKKYVRLTEMGSMILEQDPYLEDLFSLWLIHCNIARNREHATAWNLFFNEFDSQEFTPEYLKQEMLRMVSDLPDLEKHSQRSVQDDCDAILRMYARPRQEHKTPEEKNVSPFAALGLVRQVNGIYRKEQPPLNKLPGHVVRCLMPEGRDSVSIEELLEEKNGPGKLLHLKRGGLLELLEDLAVKGMIEMNRTAGLDMVYLKEQKSETEIAKDYFRHLPHCCQSP